MRNVATRVRDLHALAKREPVVAQVLLAQMLGMATSGIMVAVLPFLLLSRGLSLFQIGGAFTLVALAGLVAPLAAGRWPYIFGRRGLVLFLMLAGALCLPGYLFAVTPIAILGLTAVRMLAGGLASPGISMLLAEASPAGRRAEVFGHFGAITSLSYAAGAAAGGFLLASGFRIAFAVGSTLALLGALLLIRVIAPSVRLRAGSPAEASLRRERALILAALSRVRSARMAIHHATPVSPGSARARWRLALHGFLFATALAIYPVYFPMHLVEQGLPLAWTGVVVASGWVSFGIVQPAAGRWADRARRPGVLVIGGLLAAGLLNLALGYAPLVGIVLAWVVLGIADGVTRPVTMALLVNSVRPEDRARTLGTYDFAIGVAMTSAPFGVAFLIRAAGIPAAFVAVGVLVALSSLPLLSLQRSGTPGPDGSPEVVPA